MNKSNQNNRKDEAYHVIMESKGLMNFSKWFKNCMQGQGDTGGTETYTPYDAWMRTAKGKYVVEIKCRDVTHERYDKMMIEIDKYDALCSYADEGMTPLYFSFFTDGWCIVYDLTKVTPITEEKHNCRNKGFSTIENNNAYLLPVNQGDFFKYE